MAVADRHKDRLEDLAAGIRGQGGTVLRLEVTQRHVRVSLVERGATATELAGHNRPEVLDAMRAQVTGMQPLAAEDIADMIASIVTRPRHVAVNEVLIRPTEQA